MTLSNYDAWLTTDSAREREERAWEAWEASDDFREEYVEYCAYEASMLNRPLGPEDWSASPFGQARFEAWVAQFDVL